MIQKFESIKSSPGKDEEHEREEDVRNEEWSSPERAAV